MADLPEKPDDPHQSSLVDAIVALSRLPKEVIATFVEAASRGCGTIWEPLGIFLKAKAESAAQITRAEAEAEVDKIKYQFVTGLESKAILSLADSLKDIPPEKRLKTVEQLLRSQEIDRVLKRERRLEANRASILQKAIPHLSEESTVDNDAKDKEKSSKQDSLDPDWLDAFFRYCEIVSDDNIQEVWAKIFAGKMQNRSKFSKKTIRSLQDISHDVAQLFAHFCSVVFKIDGDLMSVRLENDTSLYLDIAEITFDQLLLLDEHGLVSLGTRAFKATKGTRFDYFGQSFVANQDFQFRNNPLTHVGTELYPFVTANKKDDYFNEVKKLFGSKVS